MPPSPRPVTVSSPRRAGVASRPTVAVWKFASCDGCQLSLLDCEDELLALAGRVRIAQFTEMSRARVAGPYDLSLVEGSITTPEDEQRIQEVRRVSRRVVTIGACATAGGIQALRNFAAGGEYAGLVYAHPEYLSTLDTSTPVSSHIAVDLELHGCPVDRTQLLDVISAFVAGGWPRLPSHTVCQECKARGTTCLLVAKGTACLGPVTRAGCGALCPAFDRGCFGCFGPSDGANTRAISARLAELGQSPVTIGRLLRTFNAAASPFAEEATSQFARAEPRRDGPTEATGRPGDTEATS